MIAFAVRAGALLLVLAALLEARSPAEPVQIDLAGLSHGVWRGAAVPLPVTDDHAGVVLDGAGALDLYLRVPRGGRLLFGTDPDGAQSVAITVTSDTRSASPSIASTIDGDRSADLSRFAGEAVRLTIDHRADGRAVLQRPRVIGVAPPRAPVLAVDPARAPKHPNVLLYLIDTLRADRLSVYGYPRPTSPVLDALAARSILFMNAQAPGPSTLHTIPSLFASRLPSQFPGTLGRLASVSDTLALAFQRAGYHTAAFQTNPFVVPALGYAVGFDSYQLVKGPDGTARATAGRVNEELQPWLLAHRDRPFFVFVQTFDVHSPYEPPPAYRDQFGPVVVPPTPAKPRPWQPIDSEAAQVWRKLAGTDLRNVETLQPERYDASIAYTDHELGNLLANLEHLGLANDTIVAVTADHGEALGNLDDGSYLHGHSLYSELTHVPLILSVPGAAGGQRIEEPVSLIDLGPTLLELAGIAPPAEFVGRSLLRGRDAAQPPVVVGERLTGITHASDGAPGSEVAEWYVREGSWKAVGSADGIHLFDLAVDPTETADVAAQHPVLAEYLASRRWPRQKPETVAPAPLEAPARRQVEDALRTLGYIQ